MSGVERRGGNVNAVSAAYGISPKKVRSALASGELQAHAAFKRTVILFSEVET
jgi:hypothetical protein